MYSALELARAAGYLIRPVPTGGARATDDENVRLLEVGPDATDAEIKAFAAVYIVLPDEVPAPSFRHCASFVL